MFLSTIPAYIMTLHPWRFILFTGTSELDKPSFGSSIRFTKCHLWFVHENYFRKSQFYSTSLLIRPFRKSECWLKVVVFAIIHFNLGSSLGSKFLKPFPLFRFVKFDIFSTIFFIVRWSQKNFFWYLWITLFISVVQRLLHPSLYSFFNIYCGQN